MAELKQVLSIAGVPAVFAAKARAFFKAHRESRMGKGRWWLNFSKWLLPVGYVGSAGALVGILGLLIGLPFSEVLMFFGIMAGIPTLIGGYLAKWHGQGFLDAPEVVPDVQALLRALADDWAARLPLDGTLDLREASVAVSSERSATSPYSGASKLYYRHPWFRAAGRLVDGSVLAIEGIALVKTKSGAVIRTQQQLKGRLRPGTLLKAHTWRGERSFGRLQAVVSRDAGTPEVLFWAPVTHMDEVLPDLEALVWALAGRDPAGKRGARDDAGGAVGPALS